MSRCKVGCACCLMVDRAKEWVQERLWWRLRRRKGRFEREIKTTIDAD